MFKKICQTNLLTLKTLMHMKTQIISFPPSIEPLKSNRWVLEIKGVPKYLVRNFHINTVKGTDNFFSKLTFSVFCTNQFMVDVNDMVDIQNIEVKFLAPAGEVINGYNLETSFDKMDLDCNYSDDGLLTYQFEYWIKNMTTYFQNSGRDVETNLEIESIRKTEQPS